MSGNWKRRSGYRAACFATYALFSGLCSICAQITTARSTPCRSISFSSCSTRPREVSSGTGGWYGQRGQAWQWLSMIIGASLPRAGWTSTDEGRVHVPAPHDTRGLLPGERAPLRVRQLPLGDLDDVNDGPDAAAAERD